MKRIIALMITFLICLGMTGIGTFAYFQDAENSGSNNMYGGVLDLVPSTNGTGPSGKYVITPGGNNANGNVIFQNMIPGESGSITWVLVNGGNMNGLLTITSNITFSDNSTNEVENTVTGNNAGGNGDLDEYIGVTLQRGAGTDHADAEANFTYILAGANPNYRYVPFSGLQAVLNAQNIAMVANGGNDTVVYKLSWSIANPLKGTGPDSEFGTADDTGINDNIIQSDTAQIDIAFDLNP